MRISLRHWRAPHLLGAWVAYWLGLGVATLGRPLMLVRRFPESGRDDNSFSIAFDDGRFEAIVKEGGRAVYEAGASLLTVVLAIAGPPLLLWVLWLLVRPRGAPAPPGALGAGPMREVDAAERARERDRT